MGTVELNVSAFDISHWPESASTSDVDLFLGVTKLIETAGVTLESPVAPVGKRHIAQAVAADQLSNVVLCFGRIDFRLDEERYSVKRTTETSKHWGPASARFRLRLTRIGPRSLRY